MKKISIMTIMLATSLLQSCVFVELEEVTDQNNKNIIQSRAGENIYMTGHDNHAQFAEVDWYNYEINPVSDFLTENTVTDIYTYDGEGAVFITENGKPALKYNQDTLSWKSSGFNYAVGHNITSTEDLNNLNFQDAFSRLNIRIANSEKGLYLQVDEIRLCNILTSGTFYFSNDKDNAWWMTDDEPNNLYLPIGEQSLETGDTLQLDEMRNLPLIPQYRQKWQTSHLPAEDNGLYIAVRCRISILADKNKGVQPEKDYVIFGSDNTFKWAAIPIKAKLEKGVTYELLLDLNCDTPWYSIDGESPQTILNPITFDASLEDWDDGGDINVEV